MLLNNQEVTEKIKEEIKKIPRNNWQWKHDNPKPMGCSKSSSKMEVYTSTILLKKQETSQINNLSYT